MADTNGGNRRRTGFRQTPAGGLVAAIEQLAGARCIEDVIDTVRATARKLLGSDGITVILREEGFCHYVEEDAIGPLWKGGKFPLESCISGWAMLHRQPAVIPDIYKDERIPHELYRPTFVKSLVMAPVREEDPVAAIGAYWARVYEPSDDEIETLTTLAQAAAVAIENASLIEQLNRALNEAELARDELRHRVKNAFASSAAVARLTLTKDQAAPLVSRLDALARGHALLDEKLDRQPVILLADLVAGELKPFFDDPARLTMDGPAVTLDGEQAAPLCLAFNELATNALKHGALSAPAGRITVRWRMRGGYVSIDWTESGGPDVAPSPQHGFGSRLLQRLVEQQLAGVLKRKMERAGAAYLIEFPIGQTATEASLEF